MKYPFLNKREKRYLLKILGFDNENIKNCYICKKSLNLDNCLIVPPVEGLTVNATILCDSDSCIMLYSSLQDGS